MSSQNTTISTIFLLPTLKISREGLQNNGFINAYCIDKRRDIQYDNSLYLLFKPKNLSKFKDFLDNEYTRTVNIIDDYDYENDFVVLVYTLDDIWKDDIDLVKKGKYSKLSNEFKEQFPKTVTIVNGRTFKEEISLQWRIFSKDPKLREYWENKINVSFTDDLEVWDGWHEDKETLDIEKIKELV